MEGTPLSVISRSHLCLSSQVSMGLHVNSSAFHFVLLLAMLQRRRSSSGTRFRSHTSEASAIFECLHLLQPQMMDKEAIMASEELSRELMGEWLRNADAVFQFVKVCTSTAYAHQSTFVACCLQLPRASHH